MYIHFGEYMLTAAAHYKRNTLYTYIYRKKKIYIYIHMKRVILSIILCGRVKGYT